MNHLIQRYNNDANFALSARQIPALAFVPLASLEEAFLTVSHTIPDELQPVVDWFEDYYVGRPRQDGRRPSLFPHEVCQKN
jgi:hypothetical protein